MSDWFLHKLKISDRTICIMVFSLFISWLMAFPFQGFIIHALADYHGVIVYRYIYALKAIHIAGLIFSGFVITKLHMVRNFVLGSIAFCIATSVVFLFPPSILWSATLFISSFLVGCCIAAWAFYFRHCALKKERIKIMADSIVGTHLLMTVLNVSTVYVSAHAGLILSMILLVLAILFTLKLPQYEAQTESNNYEQNTGVSITKPLVILSLFIFIITINSGLMYQVVIPSFENLDWLISWFWSVPFIAAIIIMRNLPSKINKSNILYIGMSLMGMSFIAFTMLDRSVAGYLIVNTLMLGSFGIFDLFWWSILGEMFDFKKNPAKIFGIGLAANVLGIIVGGLTGFHIIISNMHIVKPTFMALIILCITLAMLPPLIIQLSKTLKGHSYLYSFAELKEPEKKEYVTAFISDVKLTGKEKEIAYMLVMGKTCRMIAEELRVSDNTIKTHVRNIYAKLGAKSRTDLLKIMLEIKMPSEE